MQIGYYLVVLGFTIIMYYGIKMGDYGRFKIPTGT